MRRTRRLGPAAALVAMAWTLAPSATTPSAAAPGDYTITLAADPATTDAGSASTLTTRVNRDLSTSRYSVWLFDQADPTWYRTCKPAVCSFPVSSPTPTTRSFIAYVARDREPPRYPPMQIQATSNAVTVTWTAVTYVVALSADRTWLPPGATSTLTAQTNRDVAGTGLSIQVYDLTDRSLLAACTSGTVCEVPVVEVSPATQTYQAFVASPGATPPPPNVQASSNVVTVTWSVLPDPSRPPNAGGGPLVGTVVFDGAGVPPLDADCAATSFRFTGTSASAWLNGSGTAYAGPLTVTATGGSTCENAQTGVAAITVSGAGTSATGRVSCGPLHGTVTRTLSDTLVVVSGDCVINDVEAFRVRFVAKGEFVPTQPGAGTTAPVTEALFAGTFVIVPD